MQVISPPKMTAFESGNGANNSVYSEKFESTEIPVNLLVFGFSSLHPHSAQSLFCSTGARRV